MKNRAQASGRNDSVSAALTAPKAKPVETRDTGRDAVRGLLLRVQPPPSKVKAYYLQLGRGKRVYIGDAHTTTLKRARELAKQKIGDQAGGVDVQAEARQAKLTLGKFIDGDWTDYGQSHIASFENMKATVKRSFRDLLETPMADIGELEMARWRKGRNTRTKEDGTPRKVVNLETIRREVTYLRAILNYAVTSKTIASHQLARYKVAGTLTDTHSKAKLRYLSPDEEKALRAELDAREGRIRKERESANKWRRQRKQPLYPAIGPDEFADHIKPLVLLALNTGLRRGDLFDLEWSEVDLELRQIRRVIGKSSHARRKHGKPVEKATLPLSAEAHKILVQLHEHRNPASELVFPSPVSGTRLDNIKKAFAQVLTDAEIPDFTFHDLRHSFASKLVMAGVDLNTVRELMTHSDIKMTLVYAHLSPDHKAAALEKAFGGAV